MQQEIEAKRIDIVKQMGYKIQELKSSISSMNKTAIVLNVVIFVLSIVCSFAITNFLLGLRVDSTSNVINLTTNVGFLVCISAIVYAISLVIRHGIFITLEQKNSSLKKIMVISTFVFLIMIYAMNLFYYKDIPTFQGASLFIALLFAGGLVSVTVAGGYIKHQLKTYNLELSKCEYRPDFENVLRDYSKSINDFVNSLSQNKISNIKENLLNCQFRMIIETIVGILTAPFLAYGVSNTLASCFPEAASWLRISGIRISPIFLVLATFLIIFAFFSFVKGFTISKQIKASETIKFDGFHDYKRHGVSILGLDAIRNLNKEKNTALFIACFIILIEFTMNVSYFITEIGGDFEGIFLSIVTALVPTALLIAETHLLSSTLSTINNYNELLSMLD